MKKNDINRLFGCIINSVGEIFTNTIFSFKKT